MTMIIIITTQNNTKYYTGCAKSPPVAGTKILKTIKQFLLIQAASNDEFLLLKE